MPTPKPPAPKCGKRRKDGESCCNYAIPGGTVCKYHGGAAKHVKARAAVRAEVQSWGLGDSTVDPGEVLLRLVSQSSNRCALYSGLLQEAYEAAERLSAAHDAHLLVADTEIGYDAEEGAYEPAAVQTAKMDLDRIFNTGGVAALVGSTYGDSKTGGVYATGDQIRGLADLEARERDRCANFAAKAVAAGLAERTVRLAERQGELIASVLMAVFEDLDLSEAQREAAPNVIRGHLTLLAG